MAVMVLTGGDRDAAGVGGGGGGGMRDSSPPPGPAVAPRCCTVFGLDGSRPRRPFSVSRRTTATMRQPASHQCHNIDAIITPLKRPVYAQNNKSKVIW